MGIRYLQKIGKKKFQFKGRSRRTTDSLKNLSAFVMWHRARSTTAISIIRRAEVAIVRDALLYFVAMNAVAVAIMLTLWLIMR
jgi:hypothetical protein